MGKDAERKTCLLEVCMEDVNISFIKIIQSYNFHNDTISK